MSASATYFFIGVGGMGMAPLSIYLRELGHTVYGWDDHLNTLFTSKKNPVQRWLKLAGVSLFDDLKTAVKYLKHTGIETVVYSSAISKEHPLRRAAESLGLRCIRRGACLAELAKNRKLVAVVGSHGKTTTAGMLISSLTQSGLTFDYVLGGLFRDPCMPPAAAKTQSEWLVAEVDESDGTIDLFLPEITAVINIDWDHPGYYQNEAMVDAAFRGLFERTKSGLVFPQDNTRLEALMQNLDVTLHSAKPVDTFSDFNAINAGVALQTLSAMGVPLSEKPFAHFDGIARRQDVLYQSDSFVALADYAHHPAELDALMIALRKEYKNITVVFQPHRYTRTALYSKEFADVLTSADRAYLLEVYAASEPFKLDATANAIFKHDVQQKIVDWTHDIPQNFFDELLHEKAGKKSALVFIGAGSEIEILAQEWKNKALERAVEKGFDPSSLQPLLSPETFLKQNEPLGVRTTLRVGGPARFFAEPANQADLTTLIQAANLSHTDHFVLGRGSNLIVPDAGFDGLVISLKHPCWQYLKRIDDRHLWVGAGLRLKELCGQAATLGLAGFEFLEGIPGTVGGALRMNAGAMGSWMFNLVERVEWMDRQGQCHISERSELSVEYRCCTQIAEGIALRALLRVPDVASSTFIRTKLEAYGAQRKASQPREASAGCMFKNPPGDYAGRLIESCGLKGYAVGEAEVSNLHANFLINTGKASATDAITLMESIRARVKEATGISLEPEIIVLTKN
jgi:UDP-N-acetylmuramate--alanine ligase